MKWLPIMIVACAGCELGDDLSTPRLATKASHLVPVTDLGFDAENRPLGLLDADHRQRLARLDGNTWRALEHAENYNVLDLGTDADGSLLATIGNLPPGSGVFQLGMDDKLHQLGNRIAVPRSFEPFQSPWGDLFVSTVDGGRRLVHGTNDWTIAKALTQVVRTREAVYGMTSSGLERLGIDDRNGSGTVLLPCAAFPSHCAAIRFDGRDTSGRMYFHTADQPELWVLEAGATELYPVTVFGATGLGSVLATPQYVIVEATVDDDDGHHSYLYILPAGGDHFIRIDSGARPTLREPVLAVDHQDTVYVAHEDWLGTIELAP